MQGHLKTTKTNQTWSGCLSYATTTGELPVNNTRLRDNPLPTGCVEVVDRWIKMIWQFCVPQTGASQET